MLEELGRHVFVGGVPFAENDGDLQHVQAVQGHPRGTVGLLQSTGHRERRRSVDRADVVETEESALEDIVSLVVLAIDPPSEVQQQLLKDAFEKEMIARSVDGED